ncbi:unnamed protein product [Ixodes persulcatus]
MAKDAKQVTVCLLCFLGNIFFWGSLIDACIVIAPNVVRLGVEETVAIFNEGPSISVTLLMQEYPGRFRTLFNRTITLNSGSSELVKVKLDENEINPEDIRSGHTSHVALTVLCGNVYKKEARLLISQNGGYLFLQSDKPIYNPGQEVHLRMMAVGEDLLPSAGNVELHIKNPQDIITYNTTIDLGGSSGMHSLNYKFPDYPIFGAWKAVATYGIHRIRKSEIKFQLAEYVLPTFSVELYMPNVILPKQGTVRGTVIARYVYGKDVQGSVSFRYKVRSEGGQEKDIGATHFKELSNERTEFNVSVAEFKDLSGKDWDPLIKGSRLVVTASVLDKATGKRGTAENDAAIFATSPYTINFRHTPTDFKPGTSLVVVAEVQHANSKVAEGVECAISVVDDRGQSDMDLTKSPRSDVAGKVAFSMKTLETQTAINVTVRTLDPNLDDSEQAEGQATLQRFISPSNGYLALKRRDVRSKSKIDERFESVVTTVPADLKPVYFVALSRGQVKSFGELSSSNLRQNFIDFELEESMAPELRVLVFALHNGSILADSQLVEMEHLCTERSSINIIVPSDDKEPGTVVSVEVKGISGTRVGLMATDKAVYILDKGQLLTRQKLLSSFRSHDLGCGPGGGITSEEVISQAGIVIISAAMKEDVITTDGSCEAKKRKRRNAVRQSIESYQDPLLKECCWLGIQPDKMVRHCSTRSEIVKKFMPGPDGAQCADVFAKCCVEAENFDRGRTDAFGGPSSLQDVIDADYDEDLYSLSSIRKNFRETWMFREGNIGEDGIAKFEGSLPHSITKWFVQAVSVSPEGGICVAEPAEVTAFRKVFLQVDLPYKVVRNEQVEVLVTVYNYGPDLLYGAVFLHGVPGVCTGARHQLRPDRKPVEVKAQSAASVTFPVIPTLEGKHTIRILVNTSQGKDSVEKILNVVPEGITVEKNISIVLDPTNQQQRKSRRVKADFFTDALDPKSKRQNIKIDTQLPLEAVPNTGVLSLGVMGNQMESTAESTIANVESLISLPRGCGEQNMMLMAPTLYALEYLKQKNSQNTTVMEKAYRYIQQGYEQELAFRNDDGSFSTFKQRKGSLWLTAFVLRVFCKATKVINIDHRVLHSGVSWLAKQQRADGDFEDESPLMHGQMLGGVNGRVPMTAFVLLTLYECGSRTKVDQQTMLKVTARAENFLNERINLTREPYVAALVAYALSLDKGEKKQEAFQILKDHLLYDEAVSKIEFEDRLRQMGGEQWARKVFSYLYVRSIDTKWRQRTRKLRGKFLGYSGDTVVALQALTESGLKARDSSPDLMCNITANRPKNIFHLFRINRKNAFVLQEVHIKDIGGKLLLSVSGEGTGVLTARLRYNVLTPPEKLCKFSLAVRASRPEPGQTRGGRSRMVPQEVWKELLGDADPARTLEQYRTQNSNQQILFAGMGGHIMIENGRASLSTVAGLKKDLTSSIKNKWKALNSYEIKVCIRYLGEQDSNMAILEVGMFSGFHPIEKDLANLTVMNALLGKYELTTKGVVFYFDKVPADRDTCIIFRAERAYNVLNIQTATVKVYDYYRPDHSCSQFYSPETTSPLLGLFCDGPHCKCASAECPINETFERLLKSNPNIADFRNALAKIACNDHHFLWKVNVSDIQVSNGYKNVVFNVTSVIKEGEESKEEVTRKLRSFLMRQLCNTVNFVPGKFYFIFGQDSEFIEDKGSRIARYVLNGKVKIYAPDKNDRRGFSRRIRTSFDVLQKKFAKNESCID